MKKTYLTYDSNGIIDGSIETSDPNMVIDKKNLIDCSSLPSKLIKYIENNPRKYRFDKDLGKIKKVT